MYLPDQVKMRIQNMAIFFVQHTKNVNRMKLNKLFYFADKMSIDKTAFSISEQSYYTDNNGPVPVSIDKNKNIIPKFSLLTVIQEDGDGIFSLKNSVFDKNLFSTNELKILKKICKKYENYSGDQLSQKTHKENSPWYAIWNENNESNRRGRPIPLEKFLLNKLSIQEKEKRKVLYKDIEAANDAFKSILI